MSMLAQITALEKGKGIQYLLDSAYKILNNPIAMFDTNYSLIAYTDITSDDPLWNELISTGTFSMKTQEFFAKECFTEDVANADNIVVLKSKELKYDRMLGNIFNRDHIKVANIVICGLNDLFVDDCMVAFDTLSSKISGEIRDDEYFTAYGRAYHEEIIIKLLDRVIKDPLIYTSHVQILYDDFEDYLYVAVVDVTRSETQQSRLERLTNIKKMLEGKYRLFKYAVYSNYIVMIMSSKYNEFYRKPMINMYNSLFEQNNLFVGVSSCFENLYELREYYDEAVIALKSGSENNNGQRIFVT